MKPGIFYSKEKTLFCLFAPDADEVFLCLYQNGNKDEKSYEKIRLERDLENADLVNASVTGNLDGVYYDYEVKANEKVQITQDPYAIACGVNGKRSMVVDLDRTNPKGFKEDIGPRYKSKTDIIITEVSVADISSDPSAKSKYPGKYLAFTEKHIMDYFKDLGVTHLQIMPSYDFGSIDEEKMAQYDKSHDTSDTAGRDYNWGYDPINYNVPEGSYSTNPYDGAVRIMEYKQMVQAIHNAGLGVIMDVVYNHTYDVFGSCFYKTSGDYFYRKNGSKYSDASGCGNEIASEKPMVRQYIIDSLCYWAKEYHIDGFRFDLMGVLDIETLNQAAVELKKINPDIILYGEGWTGGDSVLDFEKRAMKDNAPLLNGYGMFSDDIRDAVKGHVFYMDDLGFVNGSPEKSQALKTAIVGTKWASSPDKSINYLSCHDNYTLWDRFLISNSDELEVERLRMNKLAAAILFTAQGIPFFLMGEEFARTKPIADNKKENPHQALNQDEISHSETSKIELSYAAENENNNEISHLAENSYCMPLYTNSIKYERVAQYKELRDYYKGLIALRKAHSGFRLSTNDEIKTAINFVDSPKNVIAYTIHTNNEDIFVVYNPLGKDVQVKLPDDRSWSICVDATEAGTSPFKIAKKQVVVERTSCVVLVKKINV